MNSLKDTGLYKWESHLIESNIILIFIEHVNIVKYAKIACGTNMTTFTEENYYFMLRTSSLAYHKCRFTKIFPRPV